MNILKYFGLDVKRCPVCDQNEMPGHVCKQPAKWSRRGFLFVLAAAPVVANIQPLLIPPSGLPLRELKTYGWQIPQMLGVGDVFTISHHYSIEPPSFQIKQFVVTAANIIDDEMSLGLKPMLTS